MSYKEKTLAIEQIEQINAFIPYYRSSLLYCLSVLVFVYDIII